MNVVNDTAVGAMLVLGWQPPCLKILLQQGTREKDDQCGRQHSLHMADPCQEVSDRSGIQCVVLQQKSAAFFV